MKHVFLKTLLQFNENLTQSDGNPNAYFLNLCDLVLQTIDKHVTRRPVTRRKLPSKRKPWINNGLLTFVETKVLLSKRFVTYKTSESHNKYKRYRNLLNRGIKQAKTRYFHLSTNNLRGNPCKLWKVIGKLIQSRKPKLNAPISIDNSNSKTQSVELFNNYFLNIREILQKKINVPNINRSHNSQVYCPH